MERCCLHGLGGQFQLEGIPGGHGHDDSLVRAVL
jgi:hypothetical protein